MPETALGAVERSCALHEKIEHVRQQVRRDPGAVVLDRDHRLRCVLVQADLDPTAEIGVLGRVREHVGDALHEPLGVAVHTQRRVAGHQHSVPALAKQRVDDLERVTDDLGELHGTVLELDAALRDSRHVEQIVDEPRQDS